METPKFREFISEAKEESYRLVILSHDDAEDPNKTGDLIREKAKTALDILTKKQLKLIKEKLFKGGKK